MQPSIIYDITVNISCPILRVPLLLLPLQSSLLSSKLKTPVALSLMQYFSVSLLWRTEQDFHLLSFKVHIFLDATEGRVNFLKGSISLLTDTELITDDAPKTSFSIVLLVWHEASVLYLES